MPFLCSALDFLMPHIYDVIFNIESQKTQKGLKYQLKV